jgi:hypothetical protein
MMATATTEQGKFFPGLIVQVDPKHEGWGGCLVVVTEVKDWGIQGYTNIPMAEGQAFIRLKWEDIASTSGITIWTPESLADKMTTASLILRSRNKVEESHD